MFGRSVGEGSLSLFKANKVTLSPTLIKSFVANVLPIINELSLSKLKLPEMMLDFILSMDLRSLNPLMLIPSLYFLELMIASFETLGEIKSICSSRRDSIFLI